MKKNKQTKKKP